MKVAAAGTALVGLSRGTTPPKPLKSPETGPHSHRTLYYMGLKKRSTQMTANTLSRATNASVNLNGPVNEFRHLVMSWDDWQEGMDVVVRHLKQKDLPAFVFPEGDTLDHTACCCQAAFRHGCTLTWLPAAVATDRVLFVFPEGDASVLRPPCMWQS